jgi:hypothetical protein
VLSRLGGNPNAFIRKRLANHLSFLLNWPALPMRVCAGKTLPCRRVRRHRDRLTHGLTGLPRSSRHRRSATDRHGVHERRWPLYLLGQLLSRPLHQPEFLDGRLGGTRWIGNTGMEPLLANAEKFHLARLSSPQSRQQIYSEWGHHQ